jgi:hypothetical protein
VFRDAAMHSLLGAFVFLRCLTFDMSGPEPAWPAKWNINKRSEAGQAGGGPLDGRVRAHLHFGSVTPGQGLFLRARRCFLDYRRFSHSRPVCLCSAKASGN